MKNYSPDGKIHLKRLSKECNTEEIMKMFDQVDNQILYDCDLQTNKLVYIQDVQDRIWEIKRSHVISPRPLTCLSSLKTVESPLSVEKEEFGFDPNIKNKTFIHDFSKLRIEISQEEGNDDQNGINSAEQSLEIDYESIKSCSIGTKSSPSSQVGANILDLY